MGEVIDQPRISCLLAREIGQRRGRGDLGRRVLREGHAGQRAAHQRGGRHALKELPSANLVQGVQQVVVHECLLPDSCDGGRCSGVRRSPAGARLLRPEVSLPSRKWSHSGFCLSMSFGSHIIFAFWCAMPHSLSASGGVRAKLMGQAASAPTEADPAEASVYELIRRDIISGQLGANARPEGFRAFPALRLLHEPGARGAPAVARRGVRDHRAEPGRPRAARSTRTSSATSSRSRRFWNPR